MPGLIADIRAHALGIDIDHLFKLAIIIAMLIS